MSDDLKQYPPTPRHLERLRASGVTPASSAVTGVVVLAAASAVAFVASDSLLRWLQAAVAQDLQRGLVDPSQLARLLAARLSQAAALVILIGVAAAALAVLAGMAQGTFPQRSSKQPLLPMSGEGRASRRRSLLPSLLPAVVACCGAAAVLADALRRLAEQPTWPAAAAVAPTTLWLRWLGLLAVAAAVHAVAVRAAYARRAQMSHREMLDDRRETEGSWLSRRRLNQRLRRRTR